MPMKDLLLTFTIYCEIMLDGGKLRLRISFEIYKNYSSPPHLYFGTETFSVSGTTQILSYLHVAMILSLRGA